MIHERAEKNKLQPVVRTKTKPTEHRIIIAINPYKKQTDKQRRVHELSDA